VEVMAGKGLELLHELIPAGRIVGLLVNPNDPAAAEPQEREVLRAARTLGLEVLVLNAGAEREFDGVFARRTASIRADDQCGRALHEP
jgi:putative ABC transport system substrate-binding protein